MEKYIATILATFLFTNISLGQVEIFEPNLISDNNAFGLTISPNGKELFYVNSFGGRDTFILVSTSSCAKVDGLVSISFKFGRIDFNYNYSDSYTNTIR